ARLDVSNLAIDRRVQVVVGDFDLELLRLLKQQLLVDHRVERLQLIRAKAGRVGWRPSSTLSVLQYSLLEVEARDRLIADDGDDTIELGVLGGRLRRRLRHRRLLCRQRTCTECGQREERLISSHRPSVPSIGPWVSFRAKRGESDASLRSK